MKRISPSTREIVRQRADGRCEYCRLPEKITPFSHQVDHIIPPRHGGTDEVDNLAWACFWCNNNKSIDIASYDPETGKLTPLFNPRTQVWKMHFGITDGVIRGLSPEGRVTVQILQMNTAKRIETRRDLIEAGMWEE